MPELEAAAPVTVVNGPICPECRVPLHAVDVNRDGDTLFECLTDGYETIYRVAARRWEPRPRPGIWMPGSPIPATWHVPGGIEGTIGPKPASVDEARSRAIAARARADEAQRLAAEAQAEADRADDDAAVAVQAADDATREEVAAAWDATAITAIRPAEDGDVKAEAAKTTRRSVKAKAKIQFQPKHKAPKPEASANTDAPDTTEYVSLTDAAAIAGEKVDTIYKRVARGQLPWKREKGQLLVSAAALLAEDTDGG